MTKMTSGHEDFVDGVLAESDPALSVPPQAALRSPWHALPCGVGGDAQCLWVLDSSRPELWASARQRWRGWSARATGARGVGGRSRAVRPERERRRPMQHGVACRS